MSGPASAAEVRAFLARLARLGIAIAALLALGTAGYVALEGGSVWFALQWSLDTIATVGSIPNPNDTGAQILKVVLIVLGVGTLFYALVTVTEFLVAGRLSGVLEERRAQRMIDSLTDHHLICGFGRVGQQVARDMIVARQRFVVIDANPASREIAREMGAPFIEGGTSEDEVLRRAGIERARTLIACVDSDAENIFAALTARELNPGITIIARASVADSEPKLKRAGANRVVSPYRSSGKEMARLALTPQIADVVEVGPGFRMEEIDVPAGCAGEGRTIDQVRGAAIVVALRRPDGITQQLPPGETAIAAGDVLIAMGAAEAMDRLASLFAPAAAQLASSAAASSSSSSSGEPGRGVSSGRARGRR